jgi:hypothetical protein
MCNPRADIGGGDIDLAMDLGEGVGGGRGVMGAGEDDELDELEEFGDFSPSGEEGEMIFADEVEELGVGELLLVAGGGIEGEVGAWRMEFVGIESEEGFVGERGLEHGLAEVGGGGGAVEFMGGAGGGDEEDAIEGELFGGVASEDEVAVVNGIESATIESEIHEGKEWG